MKPILILKYEIPLPFKVSTNKIYSWMHWRKRKSIADWYHRLTKEDCEQFDTITEKMDLEFKFYFHTRYLDSSNCSFMWKMIEDSLVKNKLVTDDSNRYIWNVTYESVEIEKKERRKMKGDYVRIIINQNK